MVVGGHNIILTGQGGSGKSYVLKKAITALSTQGKHVAITASTGIAATQYCNGQTLHSWCGLGDGGIQVDELCHLICTDERYQKAKERILKTEVLFIDECSMVSQKVFDVTERICRTVKSHEKYFGGIQVVIAGDYYQLPPVPDLLCGNHGKYWFQSVHFNAAIPHHINLTTTFVKTIQISFHALMKWKRSFERQIDVDDTTVHLFASHYQTHLFNHDQLKQFPGEITILKAEDEGDKHYIQTFQAPNILGVKLDCPVMLIVNLSDKLVNGTIGKVTNIPNDIITVYFQTLDQSIELKRHKFTKTDPVTRKTLCKRYQFPLILAFGLTMHKAQGMTLDSVVVDCKDVKVAGQIGVAIGRVKTPENLQAELFAPFDTDISRISDDNDLDWSDTQLHECLNVNEALPCQNPRPLPVDITAEIILNTIQREFLETPVAVDIDLTINEVTKNRLSFEFWLSQQYLTLRKIADNNFPDGKVVETNSDTRDFPPNFRNPAKSGGAVMNRDEGAFLSGIYNPLFAGLRKFGGKSRVSELRVSDSQASCSDDVHSVGRKFQL
ncbi:PIF1-like protein [Mya arenaria]|uniref:ATP-dependent DNA helicase n=1 Tax=Mya arenaria TaxID=6604 RepID=A0ABY7DC25_MYAAR|nr:PIF1-like protein [Mya arenaria]